MTTAQFSSARRRKGVARIKGPVTNRWHQVAEPDQKRISCITCTLAGFPSPAEICEHVSWNTGNTAGVSFFYYCLPHAIDRRVTEGPEFR